MKVADFKRNISIAFFNANNVAATLVELEAKMYPKLMEAEATKVLKKGMKAGKKKKLAVKMKPVSLTSRLEFYRDWLIKEHSKYYAKVIEPVADNFRKEDAIGRLKATKNMEELRALWVLLSEDERYNEEIIKVKEQLKAKYTKND